MDNTFQEILKGLIEVAWADGRISPEERTLLANMLSELAENEGLPPEEIAKLVALVEEAPDLAKVSEARERKADLQNLELDQEGRENVMRALMAMSFIDGVLSFTEYEKLERFSKQMKIDADRMETLRQEAVAAVKELEGR